MKTALTIAGSDSSGGAGIEADLKTFSVLGVFGMCAITSVTAQNTLGVKESLNLPAALVRQQIDVTASDIQVDATKSGMLGTAEIVEAVEGALKSNKLLPYICDSVMRTKNGDVLTPPAAVEAMKKRLFPLATVVTASRYEASVLAQADIDALTTVAAAKEAARRITGATSAPAIVIKGIDGGDQVIDVFFDGKEFYELAGKKQPDEKSHGSGCAFSAAIAAGLANRLNLVEAIDQAKQLVNMAIQHSDGQGRGTAPVNVLAFAPKKIASFEGPDGSSMLLRIGYDLTFDVPAPTPIILMLYVHPDRAGDLVEPERILIEPKIPISDFIDCFGNRCARIVAPAGRVRLRSNSVIRDSGLPEAHNPQARQAQINDLPLDVLQFLLASRYCEVDQLSNIGWELFGRVDPGWPRVAAICNWVFENVRFGYSHARPTKSAWDVYFERRGVCRDFMHLAIAFCRCVGIPARYATGYLGDIGVPPVPEPMDFSAYFEVYLDGKWWSLDARHNMARIGRVLMARGRDAVDVALTTSFGQTRLANFSVVTDEVPA